MRFLSLSMLPIIESRRRCENRFAFLLYFFFSQSYLAWLPAWNTWTSSAYTAAVLRRLGRSKVGGTRRTQL